MHRFLAVALITSLAGCASSAPESLEYPETDNAVGTSLSGPTYVSVRHDPRRCPIRSPRCGGYFVHDLNRSGNDRYVSGFDLSKAGLDKRAQRDLYAARDRETILRGVVGQPDPDFGVSAFVVYDAYLGMPGASVPEGDAFYTVAARSPKVACFAAPCPNEVAQQLNRADSALFDGVRVAVAAPMVDQAWLTSRVLTHHAVVAGTLVEGEQYPAGKELVLIANQVFVRLPDRTEPCPVTTSATICEPATEQVMTFRRDSDRCLVPTGCAKPGTCTMDMPVCGAGYALSSWIGSDACNAYACDPTFAR